MFTFKNSLIVGAVLSFTSFFGMALANAWPIPLTGEEQRMIANARNGGFPGDDDQIMLAGRQACQFLYTGQSRQQVIDGMVGRYGATTQQANALVNAAKSTICTQAPG